MAAPSASMEPDTEQSVVMLCEIVCSVAASAKRRAANSRPAQAPAPGLDASGSRPQGAAAPPALVVTVDDAQLAQESLERLAAILSLAQTGGHRHHAGSHRSSREPIDEEVAMQRLPPLFGVLARQRLPEAIGDLCTAAAAVLMSSPHQHTQQGVQEGGGGVDFGGHSSTPSSPSSLEQRSRRRSLQLRRSVELIMRDGGKAPTLDSLISGAVVPCGLRLGGRAQGLLEAVELLLVGSIFDVVWACRDLLAFPEVRLLVQQLASSSLLRACGDLVMGLGQLLKGPPSPEAASYVWLLGFVANEMTGLCRCAKAMVEFEGAESMWAQLGDPLTQQLLATQLPERFCRTASAVHANYVLPAPHAPPPGDPFGADDGTPATAASLRAAVETFLQGMFHFTWHHLARGVSGAGAGRPPGAPRNGGSSSDASSILASAKLAMTGSNGWKVVLAGRATHQLVTDWLTCTLAYVEAEPGSVAAVPSAALPALHVPSYLARVPRRELLLQLSVCVTVAAAGGPLRLAALAAPPLPHELHALAHQQALARRAAGAMPSAPAAATASPSLDGRPPSFAHSPAAAASHSHPPPPQPSQEPADAPGGSSSGSNGDASAPSGDRSLPAADRLLQLLRRALADMAASWDAEVCSYAAIAAAHKCASVCHRVLDAVAPPLGAFATEPAPHTRALLDVHRHCLVAYSAFLQPDPEKDAMTLAALEACHERLLELCIVSGPRFQEGVLATAYATGQGLLLALEADARGAAMACRLQTLGALLEGVMSSGPALDQLDPKRDARLFVTLRKLMIMCITLASPHPATHQEASRQQHERQRQQSSDGEGEGAEAAGGAAAAARKPRVPPLALQLLSLVSMLTRRFLEEDDGVAVSLLEGQPPPAAASAPAGATSPGAQEAAAAGAAAAAAPPARLAKRPVTAQLLPYALSQLAGPAADLADAVAQAQLDALREMERLEEDDPGSSAAARRRASMLSTAAAAMHTLFRLCVALTEVCRRQPHRDWEDMLASMQPQQLVSRAMQLLLPYEEGEDDGGVGMGGRSRLTHPMLLSSLLAAAICGVQHGWLPRSAFDAQAPRTSIDLAPPGAAQPGAQRRSEWRFSATGRGSIDLSVAAHQEQQQRGAGADGRPASVPELAATSVQQPRVVLRQLAHIAQTYGTAADQHLFELLMRLLCDPKVARRHALAEAARQAATAEAAQQRQLQQKQQQAAAAAATSRRSRDSARPGSGPGKRGGKRGGKQQRRRLGSGAGGKAGHGGAGTSGSGADPDPGASTDGHDAESSASGRCSPTQLDAASHMARMGSSSSLDSMATSVGALAGGGASSSKLFWVPPSEGLRLRACCNPCCINLAGASDAFLELQPCTHCDALRGKPGAWYCSSACRSVHMQAAHGGEMQNEDGP